MPEEFIDHEGKRLVGPLSLEQALDVAEADGGVAIAISVPEGRYVAARFGDSIHVRQVNEVSGQGGSQMGTGRWLDGAGYVPGAWRPA